jgi:hypothetical protein
MQDVANAAALVSASTASRRQAVANAAALVSICKHGKQKASCRECGGSGSAYCKHGKRKNYCWGGCGPGLPTGGPSKKRKGRLKGKQNESDVYLADSH